MLLLDLFRYGNPLARSLWSISAFYGEEPRSDPDGTTVNSFSSASGFADIPSKAPATRLALAGVRRGSLIAPRRAVGSVNLAEFFITVSISITFFTQLDLAQYGKLVIGLIIGGALASAES